MQCARSAGEETAHSPANQSLFGTIAFSLLERVEHSVVLVNGQCEVLYKNNAARMLVQAGRGVSLLQRRLSLVTQKNEPLPILIERLAASERQELSSPLFRVRRSKDMAPLTGQVFRMALREPLFMIVFNDFEHDIAPSVRAVGQLFGFTNKEVELVTLLVQGSSLKEAAQGMQIGEITARNHLARAVAKAGAQGQRGLIQLVLRTRIPFKDAADGQASFATGKVLGEGLIS